MITKIVVLKIFLTVAGIIMIMLGLHVSMKSLVRGLKNYGTNKQASLLSTLLPYFIGLVITSVGVSFVISIPTYELPPPIKLILLDIDGVLNHNKAPKRINASHLYDPACIEQLNKLIELSNKSGVDTKVVVCSRWRIGHTVESMQEVFDYIGVKAQVIGLTPWLGGCYTYDDEISTWLSNYEDFDMLGGIVLIDDDSSERFAHIQVKPSWRAFGMRHEHAQAALGILSAGMPSNFDTGKVITCKSVVKYEIDFGGHHIQKTPLKPWKTALNK